MRGRAIVLVLALAGVAFPAVSARPGEPPAAAPAAGAETLGAVLEPIREKHGLPALAAVLVVEGKVVLRGATGLRAVGSPEAVTSEDLWHIGSDTKAMTATLCARLVEKGVLSWSTTVAEAFPDLKDAMDPAWGGVTLEHLLTNKGGVPSDLRADGLWSRLFAMDNKGEPPRDQRRALLLGVTAKPPLSEPGTKELYSNAGFVIAGHIAETKAGKTWEELMRDEVFAPLGITRFGFGPPGSKDAVDQPRGHRGRTAPFTAVAPGAGADNPQAIAPAGTVHIALDDWAKFVAAHASSRGDFLKPESWARLHAPTGPKAGEGQGYAMGWGVTRRPWAKGEGEGAVGRVLTHAGSNTMWFAVAWVAPERGLAVLVATNAAGEVGPKAADEAVGAALKRFREGGR